MEQNELITLILKKDINVIRKAMLHFFKNDPMSNVNLYKAIIENGDAEIMHMALDRAYVPYGVKNMILELLEVAFTSKNNGSAACGILLLERDDSDGNTLEIPWTESHKLELAKLCKLSGNSIINSVATYIPEMTCGRDICLQLSKNGTWFELFNITPHSVSASTNKETLTFIDLPIRSYSDLDRYKISPFSLSLTKKQQWKTVRLFCRNYAPRLVSDGERMYLIEALNLEGTSSSKKDHLSAFSIIDGKRLWSIRVQCSSASFAIPELGRIGKKGTGKKGTGKKRKERRKERDRQIIEELLTKG